MNPSPSRRPEEQGSVLKGLILTGLGLVLVVGCLLILEPWESPGLDSGERDPLGEATTEQAAEQESAAIGKEAEPGPLAESRPRQEAEAERRVARAHTVLRGRFQSAGAVWPGGGRVSVKKGTGEGEGGLGGILDMVGQLGQRAFTRGKQAAKTSKGKAPAESPAGELPETGIVESSSTDRREPELLREMLGRGETVAETDLEPDGSFVFEDLQSADYELFLKHPRFLLPKSVRFRINKGQKLDLGEIQAEAAAGLLILVTDKVGRPVERAELGLQPRIDMDSFMDPKVLSDFSGLFRSMMPKKGRTDGRGSYLYGGLTPGQTWQLKVESSSFAPLVREVHTGLAGQSIVRVELAEGARILVRARDKQGEPCKGARLRLVFRDMPAVIPFNIGMRSKNDDLGESRWLKTDASGTATARGLPAGRAILKPRENNSGYLHAERELVLSHGEETTVDLVLDPGLAISGRIVDEDGVAVEGARVISMPDLGQKVMGFDFASFFPPEMLAMRLHEGEEVDAEGLFVIHGFEADERINVMAGAPDYALVRAGPFKAGESDIEIILARAAVLEGVVQDESGEPISDYRVKVKRRAFLVLEPTVASKSVIGSEDGRFELRGVARDRLTVKIEAPGRAPFRKSIDFRDGSVDLGVIRLGPPAGISGTTVDPDGRPMAGVTVRVSKGGFGDSRMLSQILGRKLVESDANGRFSILGLPARKTKLIAEKQGYPPLKSKAIRVRAGEIADGIRLQLSKGGSLHGRITDDELRPLEGWRIQAQTLDASHTELVKSDHNGEFLIDGLLPGSYQVDAMPSDYMKRLLENGAAFSPGRGRKGGRRFDFSSMISNVMRNIVRDRVMIRDGQRAELHLVFKEPELPEGLILVEGRVTVGGMPMENGMLFLVEPGSRVQNLASRIETGRFRIKGVVPGTYRVQITRVGFGGMVGPMRVVDIPETSPHRLDIRLPGGRISGRVLDADTGSAAQSVIMSLRSEDDSSAGLGRADLGEGNAISDAEGKFLFDGLPAGTYDLFAKEMIFGRGKSGHLGQLRVADGQRLEKLTLYLGKGGSIEATVHDRYGTKKNAMVMLLSGDGKPINLFHRALTDPDGEVQFKGLPAGDYVLSVDAPGSAPLLSERIRLGENAVERLDLSLEAGVPCSLSVEGDGSLLRPGELVVYSVWRDGALLRTGTLPMPAVLKGKVSRSYELGRLRPGSYELRLESSSLGIRKEKREVPSRGRADWKLELGK
ncbi:MAG: carboxypeptidase regulatory-like domain-containing protein [Planctomycetota bacterium]